MKLAILGIRFKRGETTGSASSVEIVTTKDDREITGLVGFGHALYAVRWEDGTITSYGGWLDSDRGEHHGSVATNSHYGKLGIRSADYISMEDPSCPEGYLLNPQNLPVGVDGKDFKNFYPRGLYKSTATKAAQHFSQHGSELTV